MKYSANSVQSANLVYFEDWVDPVAMEILSQHPQCHVKRLRYGDPIPSNLEEMKAANGYQIAPRGELQAPWFGDEELLQQCPQLLAISSTGSGYDMVDVDACTKAGVIVVNQTGSNRIAVAEHALGLMLALVHKLVVSNQALRFEDKVNRFECAGSDLNGKTVGLVGIGQIGSKVASFCRALGMTVLAYDPYLQSREIVERSAIPSTFDELLAASDIVSVHTPRTEETMNMFDANTFSKMKHGAYFISTARGGIHNEADLYAALRSRHLAGAGLDVFLQEPPPKTHPLLSLDNVIATPHSAGLSREAVRSMASYAATQWIDIFKGGVPPRLVNPEAWPMYRRRFGRVFGFMPESL